MDVKIPISHDFIYHSNESIWCIARRVESSTARAVAFYDIESNRRISDWYWGALPFSEGFGLVNEDGRLPWQFVDRNLVKVFDVEFEDASSFSQGLAAVSLGDEGGYIDKTGQMQLLLTHEELRPFNRFGWAFANHNALNWDIDIIDQAGQSHVTKLETADFCDGDYPYFKITRGSEKGELEELLMDMKLNTIHNSGARRRS
jgi:hypothetical protein